MAELRGESGCVGPLAEKLGPVRPAETEPPPPRGRAAPKLRGACSDQRRRGLAVAEEPRGNRAPPCFPGQRLLSQGFCERGRGPAGNVVRSEAGRPGKPVAHALPPPRDQLQLASGCEGRRIGLQPPGQDVSAEEDAGPAWDPGKTRSEEGSPGPQWSELSCKEGLGEASPPFVLGSFHKPPPLLLRVPEEHGGRELAHCEQGHENLGAGSDAAAAALTFAITSRRLLEDNKEKWRKRLTRAFLQVAKPGLDWGGEVGARAIGSSQPGPCLAEFGREAGTRFEDALRSDGRSNNALLSADAESGHTAVGSPLQPAEGALAHTSVETASSQRDAAFPEPSTPPDTSTRQAPASRKRPPSPKPGSSARKQQRLRATPAAAQLGLPNSKPRISTVDPPLLEGDGLGAPAPEGEPATPKRSSWGGKKGRHGVTSPPLLPVSPSTAPPVAPQAQGPHRTDLPEEEAAQPQAANKTRSPEEEAGGGALSRGGRGTTTSTIVTTTVITTETTPSLCGVNFYEPEGYIESTDYPPLPQSGFLECTFNVTVYTGYGVELQVKSVNLSEGEVLSIRGVDGERLVVLANHTLLVEGQVIRSPTNTISVLFRTFQDDVTGTFQLHYQVFMLSCSFPRRPDFGEVTVMGLHSGGTARFQCHLGYELEGPETVTCINASKPHWSWPAPICSAPCGGTVRNATLGRILAPTPGRNRTESTSCVWTVGAPEGQKLHLHFERLQLRDRQRMVVYDGETKLSAVLYSSQRGDVVPFEGVISEGHVLRIDYVADGHDSGAAFNIRFEAFEKGHCYEPYIQNGNFTTSDPTYNLGAIVEFTCDPGHSLEQGPATIECINIRDPYWNDTEPLCRVTVYDGEDPGGHVLGQFPGGGGPQKLYSSTPDLAVQFHSDPAGLVFGKGQGFVMSYIEVSRNDSCSDLPEIQNGWKTTSHAELVREAKITYQCDPGYDIVGSDTLTCQWDLTWSSDPPFCEKIMYCTDPGEVSHSTRLISDPVLLVGTTIQYTCNPGFVMEGSALLTCYSRETGTPIWTSRLPHCVSEESLACGNPGLPENGYQVLYKRLYLPGESLTFMCYEGFELIGEVTIQCILGQPSRWSGPLPVCKVNQDSFEHALEAEAAAETSLEGGNMALAIFIPVLVVSLLLGGAYIYVTRCRSYSSLRLPLMYSHPYSQITVETEFDNPIYETGETREYEVSI
ncbi:seizure 6-like protein [Varanus komodoensis]|uniref:seizure 6-like protein n=1 Tax=Varanus komodoensis TaxID=61221 RepID=UPI001CF7BB56|nr:seizure 6-like protein [Varanus komodoensis]